MMKKALYVVLLCVGILMFTAQGQEADKKPAADSENQLAFWKGTFVSGEVAVHLDNVAAYGLQRYVLDGNFFVHELTIDARGSSLIRIYYIEPLAKGSTMNAPAAIAQRAAELMQDASDRTGAPDPNTVVTKSYPTTTHAHTMEFRVGTAEEIKIAYESLQKALQSKRGRTFRYKKAGK